MPPPPDRRPRRGQSSRPGASRRDGSSASSSDRDDRRRGGKERGGEQRSGKQRGGQQRGGQQRDGQRSDKQRRGQQRDGQSRDRTGRLGSRGDAPRRATDRRREPREPEASGGFGPYARGTGGSTRRRKPDEPDRAAEGPRARYRVVGERRAEPESKQTTRRAPAAAGGPRRRRRVADDVRDEILKLGGSRGPRYYDQLTKAADAFARDRERDALRLLRPLRDALPDAPSVRELTGLAHYRLGQYPAAAKELEAYVELTGAVDQHPVLMDCYRAQRRWRKVDACWQELAAVSPSAELVTEGRIVAAGALADRGRLDDAISLLGRRDKPVTRPREHHLRLWYALADLEERAGNIPRARSLFERVRREDAGFSDVAERLAAIG